MVVIRRLDQRLCTGGWDGRVAPPHCKVGRERPMEMDGDLCSLLLVQLLDFGLEDQEAL